MHAHSGRDCAGADWDDWKLHDVRIEASGEQPRSTADALMADVPAIDQKKRGRGHRKI